jgi:predicted DNA-binding transcriptional regulator AlpA
MDIGRETERPTASAAGGQPARTVRTSVLPASLPPRGLNRIQAAEYVGVSPTLFDRMAKDGRMPRGRQIDGRVVWDRHELDVAFDALPHSDERTLETTDDPWSKVELR